MWTFCPKINITVVPQHVLGTHDSKRNAGHLSLAKSWNVYFNSVGKLVDHWRTASNSTWQLACDKGVFSAQVCFVHSLNGHCPNDGQNATVLATTSKTEGFLYWICRLRMLFFSL